ncbi:hypothetical protein [Schleiferilactobacillus perolens]|uniref:galactosylceramidase n=1 Tax=Schleiferilactobacillus perolens DSM 12744 TaxID=1423792 RepID=A0A0R1NA26_9LACO|nr:hypothetical protein [Schleiferilactobacillus perolens]KRL13787.1 hypothetical protein FD09_GL001815 [Schleiferilactobacillus perolens DSM 12744]
MDATKFTIDGHDLHTDWGDANTFKGFGYLSCNNSSRLLLDYKWEHPEVYAQLLQLLFGGTHPLMRMLKIELGNDANTSSGTEPAPLRSAAGVVNVRRGMGFQLIADAKKIQPNLMTSLLRWGEPGWLRTLWRHVRGTDPDHEVPTEAYEPMYQYYKKTIIAAWQTYGFLFNYVDPDRNATRYPMYRYIQWFAKRLAVDDTGFPADFPIAQYQQIKIIAADQNYDTDFGSAMVADPALRALVPAVGYHYNTADGPAKPFTALADTYHHEVWYSEGIAPTTNGSLRQQDSRHTGIGGVQSSLDVANRWIKSYHQSRRSHYIFQPALAAFYPGVRYAHKDLIIAQTPWSGFFSVDNIGIQVLKHFTDFATAGWLDQTETAWRYINSATYSAAEGTENVSQQANEPSYLTLASPDGRDVSTIFVNDSDGPQHFIVQLANLLTNDKPFHMWETRGRERATEKWDDRVKQLVATLPAGDHYEITVPARAIATVTTLTDQPAYQRITAANPDVPLVVDAQQGILFQDDYAYQDKPADYLRDRGGAPQYTTDLGGAFEVQEISVGKRALVQQITEQERALDWEESSAPNFTIGDDRWENYRVNLGFTFDTSTRQNSAEGNYVALGLREQLDPDGSVMAAPYVTQLWPDGRLVLWEHGRIVARQYLRMFDAAVDHELIMAAVGHIITVLLDGAPQFEHRAVDRPALSGRVKVGTGYYHTIFHALSVTAVPHQVATSARRWDDLHPGLTYTGQWQHLAGQASDYWERSYSVGQADSPTPTTLQFHFRGTGFALIGGGNETGRLDIQVDDQLTQPLAAPLNAPAKQPNFIIAGLAAGEHTVTITVAQGSYLLDAIEVIE